jgi:hypothetical protein
MPLHDEFAEVWGRQVGFPTAEAWAENAEFWGKKPALSLESQQHQILEVRLMSCKFAGTI